MTSDRDDEALSWGDDDPTLDTGASADSPVALPKGFTAVGAGSDRVAPVAAGWQSDPVDSGESALSNTALLVTGVLAGVYLLFTIGWVIGGIRLGAYAPLLGLDSIGFQVSFWLAVVAPALWFLTVLLLARRAKFWVRVVLIVAGAALLVPWPFIMVGVIGQ